MLALWGEDERWQGMKLEEAIIHLEETLADPSHVWSCSECRAEHEQLLEWLKELLRLRTTPKNKNETF